MLHYETICKTDLYTSEDLHFSPRAPLTYFNDERGGGGGGGGGPSDFFGSEILAKGDFLGSMKDAGIFWGREKKQRDFFGLRKKE